MKFNTFEDYAELYDLLNSDKNYDHECDYLSSFFHKKKNLNNGFVRELFEHNYPVRTISDVGGEILWAGSWVNTETLKEEN